MASPPSSPLTLLRPSRPGSASGKSVASTELSLGGNSLNASENALQKPARPRTNAINVDKVIAKYKAQQASLGEDDSDDEGGLGHPPKPFVEHMGFEIAVAALIIANALVMGIGADADDKQLWYVVEMACCVCFLLEILARFSFQGLDMYIGYKDTKVNTIDLVATLLTFVDMTILASLGQTTVLRFATLFRFIRVFSLTQHIRNFSVLDADKLWLVLSGLFEALKTVFWILIVLSTFIYICAVFLTRQIGHSDAAYDPYFVSSGGWDHEVYFGTIPRSMLTLCQVMTLDGWSDGIARHIFQVQPAMVIFFVAFVSMVTLGASALLVSIVIESVLHASKLESERAEHFKREERQRIFGELRVIFADADADESGMITLEEMAAALGQTEIYNKLKMIDFPVDDPEKIFILLDYDESGELSIDEFITGCVRMRGTANSKDLLVAQVAVDTMRRQNTIYEKELATCREKALRVQETVTSFIDHGEHLFLDVGEYRRRHPEMAETSSSKPVLNHSAAPWATQTLDGFDVDTRSEPLSPKSAGSTYIQDF